MEGAVAYKIIFPQPMVSAFWKGENLNIHALTLLILTAAVSHFHALCILFHLIFLTLLKEYSMLGSPLIPTHSGGRGK